MAKKLTLHRESLRQLDLANLEAVAGAIGPTTFTAPQTCLNPCTATLGTCARTC
jgi:hypothetical protein